MKKGVFGFIFAILMMLIGALAVLFKIMASILDHRVMQEWLAFAIRDGIHRLFYGTPYGSRYTAPYGPKPYSEKVDYVKNYNKPSASYLYTSGRTRDIWSYGFELYGEAKTIEDKLFALLDKWKDEYEKDLIVKVSSFIAEMDPKERVLKKKYLDDKFGWELEELLFRFDIVYKDGMWYIHVPIPKSIDEDSQKVQIVL